MYECYLYYMRRRMIYSGTQLYSITLPIHPTREQCLKYIIVSLIISFEFKQYKQYLTYIPGFHYLKLENLLVHLTRGFIVRVINFRYFHRRYNSEHQDIWHIYLIYYKLYLDCFHDRTTIVQTGTIIIYTIFYFRC